MHKRNSRTARHLKLIFFLSLVTAIFSMSAMFDSSPFGFRVATAAGKILTEKSEKVFAEPRFGQEVLKKSMADFKKLQTLCEPDEAVSVCVVGEVNFPGQYQNCRPATALSAVMSAGGPSDVGSMRVIRVFDENDFCREYDLYDFFLAPEKDNSPVLRGGETVVIPGISALVKIVGLVNRPAIYELMESEKSLGWLVKFAGGFKKGNEQLRVEIYRNFGSGRRHLVSHQLSSNKLNELAEFPLENGDVIEICSGEASSGAEIELNGHFRYPGKVMVKSRTWLSELVNNSALMYGYASEYAEVLRVENGSEEYRVIAFSPKRIIDKEKGADFVLEDGDRIVVFSRETFNEMAKVAIEGAVKSAGIYPWREGMTLSDLIDLAGGLDRATKAAELSKRQIVDGRLISKSVIIDLEKVLAGDPRYNTRLDPFDILICNQKTDK